MPKKEKEETSSVEFTDNHLSRIYYSLHLEYYFIFFCRPRIMLMYHKLNNHTCLCTIIIIFKK